MRPYVGGSCSNSEQSDSDKPGNRSMLRHQDLLRWSPLSVGHGNFAKVQQMRQLWIARIRRRTMKLSQMQIAAQAELVARIHKFKVAANIRVGAHSVTQIGIT